MVAKKYFAILGKWPALSAAELYQLGAVQPGRSEVGQDFIVFEQGSIDINLLPSQCGGIVKSGEIIFSQRPQVKELQSFLTEQMKVEEKVYLGFSFYPAGAKKQKKKELFALGIELKRYLKQQGFKVRLVESREGNLSSVIVEKNKLTSKNGVEFIYLQLDKKVYVGRTLAVQPFAELGRRDYGRPLRDDKSGMLPPKLAQIMVNLAGADRSGKLLDPFCGSGTVLQEALLLGWRQVVGADKEKQATSATQKNLTWLKGKFQLDDFSVKVVTADVRELVDHFPAEYFSAVVTEPFLGPPQIARLEVKQIQKQLFALYLSAYKVFHQLLKAGGRVVMVWPVIFGSYLPLQDRVSALGFTKVEPLPPAWQNIYHLNKRGNLEYGRVGQKVKRELTIWQKS